MTIEYVLEHLRVMIMGAIHQSRWHKPEDPAEAENIFGEIVWRLIRPSETMGTSYLQRYVPNRKVQPSTYVMTLVHHYLHELHRYESAQKRQRQVEVSLSMDSGHARRRGVSLEETVPSPEDAMAEVEHRLAREQFLQMATKPKHRQAKTRSSTGRPRSTAYIIRAILMRGLTPREVADELEITEVAVRARLRKLRDDPDVQAIYETYRGTLPSESQVA